MKQKLVTDFNIPAGEITFIHDWADKNKKDLFRRMNSGDIRIIMGSTEKLGTGTNIQKRGVAEHDLDTPWRPSDLDQRGGRLARQGNEVAKQNYNNKVKRYIYGTERTLDNYKFNLLKNKQTFISQMKNCELNVRTIDEGAIDEKSGMNFSEYIAILSGDTSLLEKSKLEKKIAVVESLKKAHFKEISRSRFHLGELQSEKTETISLIDKLSSDEQVYKSCLKYEKDGAKANPIVMANLHSADPEIIGKYLINLYHKWKPGDEPKIGSLYEFDLYIRHHKEFYEQDHRILERHFNTFYAERPETGIKYTYNQGHPNIDNPKLAARHFLNAIDKVESLKEKYTKTLNDLDKEIPMVEQIVAKPFEKERELAEMKTGLANLEREIAIKIQEKQMKENGQLEIAPDEGVKPEITIPADKVSGETVIIKLTPEPDQAHHTRHGMVLQRQVVPRVKKSKGFRM